MEKISSKLTFFYKVIFIRVILAIFLSVVVLYLIFNLTTDFLFTFLIILSPLFIGWLVAAKNLVVVYKDGRKLIVKDKIIRYENITSIGKYWLGPVYKVDYETNKMKESFIFLPKLVFLPFFKHDYIKEIEKVIREKKKQFLA